MPPIVSPTAATGAAYSEPEEEPLNVDTDTPLTPLNASDDMGFEEQFLKPEGRPGDEIAAWAAYVRLLYHVFSSHFRDCLQTGVIDISRSEC